MFVFRLAIFIFCLSVACGVKAQYDGELQFVGLNMFGEKELTNTRIKVKVGETTIKEINTKESHKFKLPLEYGNTYDVYLINAKAQTMFVRVFANIPEEKRNIRATYELQIPFFPRDFRRLDTIQFKNPFHQIVFDGKSKFVDDTTYMNAFLRKVYLKEKIDTIVPVIKTEKVKQYAQLVGKLSFDNDKQTPLKHKLVTLVNKQGEVVASTLTTNHGLFVFPGVDIESAEGLSVTLSQSENPNNEKIKLENSTHETVEVVNVSTPQNYVFKNSETNPVVKKIIDPEFKYNIGGKLISTNANVKTVASDKMVYLLGAKNNVIQKVKTNVLGNFLFTKIIPNQDYSFAFDTNEFALDGNLDLYSVKDKFIRRIDSVGKKKFNYKFFSTTQSSFNEMIVDDSELKMNVKGRLYGDNKNNPLANVKVLLLNDQYETIDTAMTNSKGDFAFNHLSYTKQFSIEAENTNSILESFSNILVFDNEDNLIKMVSLVKGKKFNYKPLKTEESMLTEVYIDDPWLSVMNRKKTEGTKTNETIIENILFEFNKAELLPQSKQTLDKVILAMNANKDFSIELSAHSDSKGSDAYNLKLSEERAKSAKDYIISKGIDELRIVAKGFGETKLLNNCGNNVKCSDDEHAVNRRLEFKLVFK